jgi:hypothetical protein
MDASDKIKYSPGPSIGTILLAHFWNFPKQEDTVHIFVYFNGVIQVIGHYIVMCSLMLNLV